MIISIHNMNVLEQRFMERLPPLIAKNNALLEELITILKQQKDNGK